MKSLTKTITLSTIASIMIIGCGNSSSSSNTSGTSVTAVDPYIQGATFYYDNPPENGQYDSGEAISSATDENGKATFSITIPDGGKVIMKDKGMHNGTPFEGQLSANISSTGIINPLTTLVAKGFTNQEVKDLLSDANISIEISDIDKDPMVGIENNLKRIRANMAVNTLLKIVGTDANTSVISDANATLIKTCALMKNIITPTLINSYTSNRALKTAVTISNYLADKTIVDGNSTVMETITSYPTDVINTVTSAYSDANISA